MALEPKIWNALSGKMKKETSPTRFKEYIKSWSGPICKCKTCLNYGKLLVIREVFRHLRTFEKQP